MSTPTEAEYLRTVQYGTGANLNARIDLHRRFTTGTVSWQHWLFDQIAVPPNCRILELGCGTAQFWIENKLRIPEGWDVTLSDFSTGMLDEARINLSAVHHAFGFQQLDAHDIPYSNEIFDAVFANFMLYHVSDRPRVFAEIRRILKPNGALFAATNGDYHMQEMWDLFAECGVEDKSARFTGPTGSEGGSNKSATVSTSYGFGLCNPFSLENGGVQLSPFFESVECRIMKDGLHVTESQALVDYLLSAQAVRPSDETLTAIRERIDAVIGTTGAFPIRKESGLFIASKPIPTD